MSKVIGHSFSVNSSLMLRLNPEREFLFKPSLTFFFLPYPNITDSRKTAYIGVSFCTPFMRILLLSMKALYAKSGGYLGASLNWIYTGWCFYYQIEVKAKPTLKLEMKENSSLSISFWLERDIWGSIWTFLSLVVINLSNQFWAGLNEKSRFEEKL